jgi:hypothetical protein
VSLASVAPSVWHGGGRADAGARRRGPRNPGPAPVSELELARAAQKAVALAQQEKSTWTRADLVKYLGRVLPRSGRDPAVAAALLEGLADRALRSEFEPVACLEAPEPVEVPRSLLRLDGAGRMCRAATCSCVACWTRAAPQAKSGNSSNLGEAPRPRAVLP